MAEMGVMTLLAIAGTTTTAVGTIYSASKQAEALNANARISEDLAAKEREKGRKQEEALRRQGHRLLSTQRAMYGISGIRTEVGSGKEVMEETLREVENDAEVIRAGADAKSIYYLSQAQQMRSQASSTMFSGLLGAAGGLITSYADFKWGE